MKYQSIEETENSHLYFSRFSICKQKETTLNHNYPVISVIMPSYNHGKYLAYAINSVLSQEVTDWELIIVDDFSTDNSSDIIHDWIKKDDRIKAIFHTKNEGIARTCNDGIKNAKGNYIAMMASDDMFDENAFKKILRFLDSSQDCSVAIIEGECIDSRNRKTGLLFSDLIRKPSKQCSFNDLIKNNFICTGIVKKSVLDNNQICYNENLKYLNDWLFWLDLSKVCRFLYIEEPLYKYRIHVPISSRNKDFADDHLKAYNMILDKYGDSLDDQSKSVLLKNAETSYRKCLHPSRLSRLYTVLVIQHTTTFKVFNRIKKALNRSQKS
jgi:glycosyltransferase involved in cell wall biosynthesis